MHQLHLAFDQDEGLRAAVLSLSEQIRGNPLKHAIVLDLNPFWLRAYRLDEAGLNSDWGWLYDPLRYAFTLPALIGGPVDLSRRFTEADEISRYVFGKRSCPGPYLLRIFARPIRDPTEQESRQALVRAARAAEIATIVETDEPPSLVAAPGDPVLGTGASGTLGGFLSDGPGGAVYGVTCGHVVAGGSVSSGGTVLGPVTHAHPPLPLPLGVMCTAGCRSMSRVDVALFGVGSAVSNVATSIANVVGRSDIVEMHGATTGKMTYEIGGAVVELELGGSCWDRLFLIHAPTVGVLPLGISVTTHPVPKPGDSGAWILRNTNEWAGMVVARSALHGYAVPATIVIGASDALFGTSLQLV